MENSKSQSCAESNKTYVKNFPQVHLKNFKIEANSEEYQLL